MSEIFVGIDGSEVSKHAVRWAAHEAMLRMFRQLRVGSVSRGVLHHSPCPVMIVPN